MSFIYSFIKKAKMITIRLIYQKRQKTLFENDSKVYEKSVKLEEISNIMQNSSINSLETVQKIKSFLKSKFNLLIEGHLSQIKNVAVTSDNKYIISCSGGCEEYADNTIRV
jgi:hypothetical protein